MKELILARKASTHFLKFSLRILNYFAKFKFSEFCKKNILPVLAVFVLDSIKESIDCSPKKNFTKSKNAEGWQDVPTNYHLFNIPHFYFHSTLKRSLSSRDLISFQNKFWKFQSSKPANTKVVQLVNPNLIFKHISLGNFTVHYMLTITFIRRRWYYLP